MYNIERDWDQFEPQKPSSEEDYVAFILEDWGIKYEREKRIDGLVGDTKQFRVADFYLPRLKIYVEYYGWYNSTKEKRSNYDLKTQVYFRNGIPTVILYPHELGIIDYALHVKITKLLNLDKFKVKLKWSRRRYKWNRLLEELGYRTVPALIVSILIVLFVLNTDTGLTDDGDLLVILASLIVFGFAIFNLFRDAYLILLRNG